MIRRVLKLLFGAGVLVAIAIAAYATFGDLAPPPGEERIGVTLDAG